MCHCPTARCSCQQSRAAPRNTPSMRWVLPVPRPLRGAVGASHAAAWGRSCSCSSVLFGALAKAHPAQRASEDRGGTTFSCPARCLWEQDSQPCRLSSCLVQVNLFDTRCKCTEQLSLAGTHSSAFRPSAQKTSLAGLEGAQSPRGENISKSRHPLLSLQREYSGRGR